MIETLSPPDIKGVVEPVSRDQVRRAIAFALMRILAYGRRSCVAGVPRTRYAVAGEQPCLRLGGCSSAASRDHRDYRSRRFIAGAAFFVAVHRACRREPRALACRRRRGTRWASGQRRLKSGEGPEHGPVTREALVGERLCTATEIPAVRHNVGFPVDGGNFRSDRSQLQMK